MSKVLVVYHSTYGHTFALARAVADGVADVQGAELVLRRVPESSEAIAHMEQEKGFSWQVYQGQQDISVCTLRDLEEASGVLFGSPTRYGNMTAAMKSLIDSTAQLWLRGAMEGKPAGVFTSTASTHGGQETTLLTMMIPLLHLGMIICGVPYSLRGMIHTEARGGTPYGASTIAGPTGELQPAEEDLTIARAQGKRVAELAVTVAAAKSQIAGV